MFSSLEDLNEPFLSKDLAFGQSEYVLVFEAFSTIREPLLLRQTSNSLIENAANASFSSYSLQELFDTIIGNRNVCVNILPDLEFTLPNEVDVCVFAAFFHDLGVLDQFHLCHLFCKLFLSQSLRPSFEEVEITEEYHLFFKPFVLKLLETVLIVFSCDDNQVAFCDRDEATSSCTFSCIDRQGQLSERAAVTHCIYQLHEVTH